MGENSNTTHQETNDFPEDLKEQKKKKRPSIKCIILTLSGLVLSVILLALSIIFQTNIGTSAICASADLSMSAIKSENKQKSEQNRESEHTASEEDINLSLEEHTDLSEDIDISKEELGKLVHDSIQPDNSSQGELPIPPALHVDTDLQSTKGHNMS